LKPDMHTFSHAAADGCTAMVPAQPFLVPLRVTEIYGLAFAPATHYNELRERDGVLIPHAIQPTIAVTFELPAGMRVKDVAQSLRASVCFSSGEYVVCEDHHTGAFMAWPDLKLVRAVYMPGMNGTPPLYEAHFERGGFPLSGRGRERGGSFAERGSSRALYFTYRLEISVQCGLTGRRAAWLTSDRIIVASRQPRSIPACDAAASRTRHVKICAVPGKSPVKGLKRRRARVDFEDDGSTGNAAANARTRVVPERSASPPAAGHHVS
jgi:hypothetical protein